MWSPDGAAITYMSTKSGSENLWRMPVAGGAAEQLTKFADGRLLYPSMAANGSAIVFERDLTWAPDSRRRLYITERGLDHRLAEYDAPSGRETLLTDKGIASVPAYAPDGKSAAYVLDDMELHLITFGAGGKPVSDRVLFSGAIATDERQGPRPTWSPDGQYIAFPVTAHRAFTNVNVVATAGGA